MTPHCSGWTESLTERCFAVIADNGRTSRVQPGPHRRVIAPLPGDSETEHREPDRIDLAMANAPITIAVRGKEQLIPGEVELFPADPTVAVQIGTQTLPIELLKLCGRQTAIAIGIAALDQAAYFLALDHSITVAIQDSNDSRSSTASTA